MNGVKTYVMFSLQRELGLDGWEIRPIAVGVTLSLEDAVSWVMRAPSDRKYDTFDLGEIPS